jgi:hypothetical protein
MFGLDWLSLIPAGVSLISGLFGGNEKKSTTTSQNSPALEAAAKKIMTEAGKIYSKPYQAYTGQRVAPPTASRTALTPLMGQIGDKVQGQLNDASGLQARAKSLLNMGPQRISVPTMVPGGPSVGMNAPTTVPNLPGV